MAEQTKKCGLEMYAATAKTQQLLSQYSSTVFACDISGDTRYIRCDFPQCRQHAAASQGKHCWLLNTLKNVKFLEGHVGKEVDFYMKEKDAEANQSTSTDNIDRKCFLETQQLQEGVTKVLAVFNLKDPQSQFGDWISLFLKAAFMAEGTKEEDCVVITQDFVSRCELMECIAKLEFLNNCSPTVEVISVLSCHSSCQGQVFSCTPTAIGKQTGFEEFCSLHDFVMACQNVLKDALTAVHVSSCFTLKLDCSHMEWPVDADWLKTKLRCILCGSTKEVYETGSQVADLHLMLSAMLPCQTAGACGTRLKDVVHRACSEGFPDLAREMGLEVVDPNRVGDRLLSAGKEDQVTPPGLVMSSVRVVLIVQDDSFSRTSDVQDEHRNPGPHVSLASALVANLKMRKASDVKFEYTVLQIKHDKTSFLNTKALINTHLDLLPCDNLKVLFVALGPAFSNPNVQLIECIKEWSHLKCGSGCYGVHFQHITAMQAYFIKNRLKETQQASESTSRTSFIDDGGKELSQSHLAVTGLVDNGPGNCSSSFPVLLYMIHLAIGENGNRLAGKGIPSAVYSNKPVGHGMSSWTLEEVYMETCHVLSGLSRKCGLHLLSPASHPVTPSSNPATPSSNPVTLSSNPVTLSSNPVTLSNSATLSSNAVIPSSEPVTPSLNPLTPSSNPVTPSSSSNSRVTVNTEVRTKGEHTAELGAPSNFDEMPIATRKELGNAPASCLASSSPGTTVRVDAETARKEANIYDFFQERDEEAAPSSCDEMPIAPEKKSNDSSASSPVASSAKAIKDRMDSMMATKEAHTVELVQGIVRSGCDEMPITRKEESGDSCVSIPVTPSTRSITDSRDSVMETEEAHTIKLVREKHGNIGPSSCDEMPATLKEGSGDSPVSIPVTASTSSITVGRGAVMETKEAHTFELVQENDGHIGPSSCDEMHTMLNKKSGNSTASVSVTPSAGTIMVTIDAKTKTKGANLIGLVRERNELAAPSCRDETPIATTEEVSYLPASSPITLSASTTCVRTDAETTIKETNIFELVQEKAERLSPSSSDEMAIQLKKESGDTLVPHHVAPFSSASTVAVGSMTTTVKGNAAEIVQGRDGHVATFICNKMPVVPDSASVSSESLLSSSSKPSNLETENHNSRVERIVDIKDSFDCKGAETSEIVKDPCKILSVQHSGVILHLDPAMKRSTTKCLLGSDVPVDCESIPFGVSCDSQPNKDFNRCTKLSTCRTDKGCDRSTEGTPLYNEKSSDDCDVNASAMSQRARKETVHKDDDDVGSSSGDGLPITYEDSRVLEGTLSRSMSEPFSLETETDKRSDSEGDLNENDGCKVADATQGIGQEPYSRENCEPSLEGSLDTGLHSEDVLVDVESVFPNSPCNDLLTFSSNKGEEPTVGIPVYAGTTVCGSTNSSTSKTKKKKKKHAKPNKTQKWLRNFVRFCKKQEGTSDCETQTSHGMRSKRLKDAGDSSAARPVSEYSASTVYVSENLQSKNKSSGVTKGKGSCQANLEVKINKGTILPCYDHDLRQEMSPSSSGLRLEESIDKIHVVMSSQSGRREANTGLDCASRNDEEGANSERADLDGILPSSEMEVDSESKSFRKRPLKADDSACKTMHVPAKLPRMETHLKDQTRTEDLSEMSESAGSSKWDESGDLPLMANVDEVLVTHYILDLTVEFSEKVMKGSIVVFLEPCNDEVTERQFQMTLDSTLVNIESVSEVVLPDDFQVPLGSLDQSCGPKPSSQESSSQWTDEETLPSFVGNFLGDKAQNPLPYKGLNYSVYGWCVRIWKPGATGQSWPRCVWIKYHTSPEGKSLTWATDQDGRPTVYSPGAYINNRSLMPCQEPSVALSTWQASIHVPEGCVVLMSGNRLAGKTLTNEGLVTYHYEIDTPLPCSTLALAVGWWQCRQSIDAATKNGNEPAIHVSCRMFAPPSLLDRAADELLDFAPKFLEAACELLGPYPFRRLDVLVLPRCFACMGLKSPNLVFLSQSLLSGDGSMRVRLAHEISHAWFGLLLGAKDWSEEWLSEGFATFVEEKIQSKAEKWSEDKDRFFRELRQILRHRCLLSEIRECDANLRCLRPRKVKSSTAISAAEAVKRSSDQSEAIRPHTVVQFGQISSRKWTQVHYLKGYFLLHHMATMVGLEEFYQFLFNYVQHYKGQLVTSEDFFEFFVQSFSSISKDVKDNFNREWLESPRIPKSFPKSFDSPDNEMTSQVEEEFITWKKQDAVNKRNKTLKAKKRKKPPVTRLAIPEQVVLFLEKLLERETISHSTLRQLNKCYNFTSGNAEIRHRWCELIVKHKFNQELMEVKRFLVEDQGMGIYLFGELIISQQAKQRALVDEVLEEIGPEMDRCTYQTVKDMLEGND